MNWDIPFLERKASVARHGSILLGKYVVCDGFDLDREVAVITHIHADHIADFERCLGYYGLIFLSPETKELLIALSGEWLRRWRNLVDLPYKDPYRHKEELITLYPTRHILGSSQVLVEDQDGVRIVYSGDFDFPNTEPIKTDVLVVDATFGDPTQVAKCNRDQLVDYLVSLTRKELEICPVCILAHRGKLQEVMSILSKAGFTVPFLCARDIFEISKVYQDCGIDVGNILPLESSAAKEIIATGERHIFFNLLGLKAFPPTHYTKIRVSRWGATTEPFLKVAPDYHIVALSDHADFSGILEYVRECNPKLVITDNYRAGSADSLAQAIRSELHIKAKAMP